MRSRQAVGLRAKPAASPSTHAACVRTSLLPPQWYLFAFPPWYLFDFAAAWAHLLPARQPPTHHSRSPAAEAIFLHQLKEQKLLDKFQADSAGTGGWHVGGNADVRMREAAFDIAKKLTGKRKFILHTAHA